MPLGRVAAESWWASARAACQGLDVADHHVDAIGLSLHSPAVVAMDEFGGVLCDAYRYEAPGMVAAVQLIEETLSPQDRDRIGNRPSPSTFVSAAYHLLSAEEPEAAARIRTLGSVGTYIGHRLTGRTAIDPSQASYFGLLDLTGDWRWLPDLAARLGIPLHLLPDLRPSDDELGTLTGEAGAELGLRAGTPVIVGAGDTACASFAVQLENRPGRLLTLGTTHVVTEHSHLVSRRNLHIQRAYVRAHEWLLHGAVNGGLALSIGAESFGFGPGTQGVQRMLRAALEAPPALIRSAPVFIPHVRAERGPLWLDSPRSALIGNRNQDESAIAWAVVEGVAFGDQLVWDSFGDPSDAPVLLAGDLGPAPTFSSVLADAFGTEVRLAREPHLPAIGAAMLGGRGVGVSVMSTIAFEHAVKPRRFLSSLLDQRRKLFQETRESLLGSSLSIKD
jgi:xylulokinase